MLLAHKNIDQITKYISNRAVESGRREEEEGLEEIPEDLKRDILNIVNGFLQTYPYPYKEAEKDAIEYALRWYREKQERDLLLDINEETCAVEQGKNHFVTLLSYVLCYIRNLIDKARAKQAILFLAAVIPKTAKNQIQIEMIGEPNFVGKYHFGLGLWVRNTLRVAGFRWGAQILDECWFKLLSEAVNLPDEKIVLSPSLEAMVEQQKVSWSSIRFPEHQQLF
jgi:hypothetical protein